ncbi:type II toxin-antitoxin system VapB family antitoxin [Geminicoccus harenae]|uniref:type II toxin-antitoxin system VapB family antitoxin n=1 Tax=Geminicoccus harenae TaxID=2498453 RepID=UPI00168AD7A7|nr:type II toxin-antitoxin system VapB family antitoxin [Geminicoccus harenae]
MALVIDDPDIDRLAQELAEVEHVSVKEAVERALRARLAHERAVQEKRRRIRALQEEVARLPVYDDRSPEEIIGYDEFGLPR